jgi:hypothetical protein
MQLAVFKSSDGPHSVLHCLTCVTQIGTQADGGNEGLTHGLADSVGVGGAALRLAIARCAAGTTAAAAAALFGRVVRVVIGPIFAACTLFGISRLSLRAITAHSGIARPTA